MKKNLSLLFLGVVLLSTIAAYGAPLHSGSCCNEEDATCHFKYEGERTYNHDQYFKAAGENGTAKCGDDKSMLL